MKEKHSTSTETGMQDTNFAITPEEQAAISDTAFFDLKTGVIKKITGLLSGLEEELFIRSADYAGLLPDGIFSIKGKISRGENYRGYPYLVLDYPRIFEKQDVFAFRSMFWWGKQFSYTMHVSGCYFKKATENFAANFDLLKQDGVFICVNTDPWQHHFEEDNYIPAQAFNIKSFGRNSDSSPSFIKLSLNCGLSRWGEITEDGIRAFELFSSVLYK